MFEIDLGAPCEGEGRSWAGRLVVLAACLE